MQNFGRFGKEDYMDAHGTFGQILKIDGQTLVIKGKDGVEKIVLVDEKTSIHRFKEAIKISDLKIDDFIVIIGEPNEAGQIIAKLIRIMPSQNDPTSTRSSR